MRKEGGKEGENVGTSYTALNKFHVETETLILCPLILSQVYVSSQYQRTLSSTSSLREEVGGASSTVGGASQWMCVEVGEEREFDFWSHSKQRHQETRLGVVHQLVVEVAGWARVGIPVSVDKTGVFFRELRE